jgi:hypothetical protein
MSSRTIRLSNRAVAAAAIKPSIRVKQSLHAASGHAYSLIRSQNALGISDILLPERLAGPIAVDVLFGDLDA